MTCPRLPTISRVLRRAGHTTLDLSESANLYLTPAQGRWFEAVLADATYQESVVAPLARAGNALPYLLGSVAPSAQNQALTVVDCGPATAEESVRKLRALQQVGVIRRYVVIDVNSILLARVKAGVAADLGFPVATIQKRFEEIDSGTLHQQCDGLVLLLFGSTGMNYEPADLRRLTRRLCSPGTLISFESLLRRDGVLTAPEYKSDAVVRFAFGPLWMLGAALDQFDFRLLPAKDRVRFEFVARRRVRLEHPDAPCLRVGDRVWTAFSRRPTLSEYQTEVCRIARHVGTFIFEDQVVASLGQIG